MWSRGVLLDFDSEEHTVSVAYLGRTRLLAAPALWEFLSMGGNPSCLAWGRSVSLAMSLLNASYQPP